MSLIQETRNKESPDSSLPGWRAAALVSFLLLAGSMAAGGAAAPSTAKSLQKLLAFPLLQAEFWLGVDGELGFVLPNDKKNPAEEIARLKKELRGTPDDAQAQYRLFELYRQNQDLARATNHLTRAVECYRRLADAQSENAVVLARFGMALHQVGREDEAEAVLRRSVKAGPSDWHAASALTRWLVARAWAVLAREKTPPLRYAAVADMVLAAAMKKTLEPGQLERAERYLNEALACANRAIKLAPQEPDLYADRALVQCYSAMARAVGAILRGGQAEPLEFYRAMFTTNAVADLDRVATLSPQNPSALACVTLFQILGAATTGREGMDRLARGQIWSLLNEYQQQSLRRSFTALENLGQSGNAAIAAPALEYLGGFQWMAMRDRTGAAKNLRRAVALDPAREAAWDFLMTSLLDENRAEEALAVAEERLKTRDTPRNRLAAAKACERLGRLDKAQTHLDAALASAPSDYLANLSAAIPALKRGRDDVTLQHAGMLLGRARRVDGQPSSKAAWIEWTITTGLFHGMTGDLETARAQFKRALEADPDNQRAKDALACLSGG